MKIWMRFRFAIAVCSVQCGFANNKRLIYYAHVVDTWNCLIIYLFFVLIFIIYL